MPTLLIDIVCPDCESIALDQFVKDANYPLCAKCGVTTVRAWLPGSTSAVIPDDIPGGVLVSHGLCNADGSPRKFYSKSEMAREAKQRGLMPKVEHVTAPHTDKNALTKRWF